MSKSEFIEELKTDIGRTANQYDPEMTAKMIHFVSSQYPLISCDKIAYVKILKVVKDYLSKDCGWTMVDIHKCFCSLHKFAKNEKKLLDTKV